MNFKDLQREIPIKWRVQSFSKKKPVATCVAYISARDVEDLLDEVVGAGNWQDDYKVINNNLFCGIGILVEGQWVWKWDCGIESQTEKEKGEASDAFKRAAVKWGVGRFLYSLPIQYLPANEVKTSSNHPYVVDSNGKMVFDITAEVNKKRGIKSVSKPSLLDDLKAQYNAILKSDSYIFPAKDVEKYTLKPESTEASIRKGIAFLLKEKERREQVALEHFENK